MTAASSPTGKTAMNTALDSRITSEVAMLRETPGSRAGPAIPRGSRRRSVTRIRNWCSTRPCAYIVRRSPNRQVCDSRRKTAASATTQAMSDPTSPVDTARSIAIPMTTGTSASPTKCPTIRIMPGSVYFPAPKMVRMTKDFGVV